MAKAQGKKAAAAPKSTARKAATRVKAMVKSAGKKVAAASRAAVKAVKPKGKPATRPAVKARSAKAAPKSRTAPKRPAVKAKPAPAKKLKAAVKGAVRSAVKAAPKAVARVKAAGKPAPKAAPKATPKPAKVAKASRSEVVKAAPAKAPAAAARTRPAAVPAAPAPAAAKPVEAEKKRGRRPRPRIQSNGVPVAAWLSSEKPRPASFIPAPPRAEAPSAIAAPPASSDRLIRPDDLEHPAVRTVPIRIDVEQGAGRFYVIANPTEVSLRPGEGIEWDFRYIGGADVTVEEIVVEFDKPSPFSQTVFKTRKPGGARPHRQLSGAASAAAVGKRIDYRVRAMSAYRSELASTRIAMTVLP